MIGRHWNLVCFVIVTLAMLSSCSHKKSGNVDSLLSSAKNYESSGQYKAAIIQLRNAIQADPKDVRGHVALAKVFLTVGQSRLAIEELENLKDQSPDSVITLAQAFIDAGKTRSASDFIEKHAGILKDRQPALNRLRGDLALERGDLKTALQKYQAVLSADSSDVAAHLGIARVQVSQGDLDKAQATVDEVLKAQPDEARALLFAGGLRTKAGDLPGAEELLTKAASATPTGDTITPLRYAILSALQDNLTRQGKTSEALFYSHLLAEATQDTKDIQEKVKKAVDAAADSDFEGARKLLTEVQAKVPDSARTGTMLGVVEYLQGDNRAAVKQFEKFMDPEVAAPKALQMFAMAELKLNQPGEIIKRLEKDIDDKKDARVVALYGIAQISAGDRTAGEKYLRRAISLEPGNERLRLPLVRLLNDEGKRELALGQLQAAYKTRPADPLVEATLIQQLLAMGRQDDAVKAVEEMRKSLPDAAPTQLVVADFYSRQGQAGKARAVLQALPTLNQSPQALDLLARLELKSGNYDTAAKRFRQIVKLNPDDTVAYKGLITAFELEKEPQKGVDEVKQMAGLGKSDAPTLVLAEYYGGNGDFDQAFLTLGEASDPDSPAATRLRRQLTIAKARQQAQKGDYQSARQTIMEKLSKTPEDAHLLAGLITVELRAGKPDEAAKILDRLQKAAPDSPAVDVIAGDIAMQQKDFAAARQHYEAAWKRVPSDVVALRMLGALSKLPDVGPQQMDAFFDAWEKRLPQSVAERVAHAGQALSAGNTSTARREYEALLKDHPNTPIALNNLAWIYGEKDLGKALEVSKKAYELAPKSGAIVDTYGWFLYKSGNTGKARQLLADAAKLAPGNAEIRKHLKEVGGAAPPAR